MRWTSLLVVTALTSACHDFRAIEADGRCGNGVVEPESGEDCDLYAEGDGTACGRPATEQACLYTCRPVADADCPGGWSCGLDGVCRAPSGLLEPATVIALAGGLLEVGHFDDDGREDLVRFDNTHVLVGFGDVDGRFSRTSDFEVASYANTPALGDVDGDGLDDAAVVQPDGVLVARGQSNRTLSPIAFATRELDATIDGVRLFGVRATAPFTRQVPLALYHGTGGIRAEVFGPGLVTDTSGVDAALATLPPELAENLPIADLDPGPAATADELAIAAIGADRVVIVSVECPDAGAASPCTVALRAEVVLAPARIAARGAFFTDLEGDGAIDLVVLVQSAIGVEIAIARGDGRGGFDAARVEPMLSAELACTRCPIAGAVVLAADDLDGDGRTEWVMQQGIYTVTSTRPLTLTPQLIATTPWRTAITADLDGDGRTDVAASRPAGVEILLAAGAGLFNTLQTDVDDPPTQLAAGDFDGDLLLDLALVEGTDVVSILFGGRVGVPSDRVVVGRIPDITAFATLVSIAGQDRTNDLVLAALDPATKRLRVFDMNGSSARRLGAPLRVEGRVDAIAIAELDGATEAHDVLMFGNVMGTHAAWLFSGERLAATDVPVAVPLSLGTGCTERVLRSFLFRAIDFDGDGEEELLVLDVPPSEGPDVGTYALEVWDVEDGRLECTSLGAVADVGAVIRLEVADLDGDGLSDAIAAFDSSIGINQPRARVHGPAFAIWWGREGTARLGDVATVIRMPSDGSLARFTTAELDGDPARELVFVDGGGVGVADLSTDRSDLFVRAARTRLGVASSAVRTLAAIDLDGSGIDGVAVGTEGDVYLLAQRPCTAQRHAAGTCERGFAP